MSDKTFEKIEEHFPDDELAAEILAFARQYRAEDFPNPAREGCPDSAVLRNMVNAGKLPEPKLADHLIACSECLEDLQKLRIKGSAAAARAGASSRRFFWFLLPATAVLAAVFVLFFVLRSDPPELAHSVTNVMENRSQPEAHIEPAVESTEEVVITALENTPSIRDAKQNLPKKPEVSAQVFNFDLAASQVTRGNSAGETPAPLPASRVRVKVRLIDNSPPGKYRVSILNSEADPAVDPQLTSSDGKSLDAEFDLTKVRGKLRLCAAPEGEIPDCIPIVVGNSN